jgi:hypothetical protein
MIAEVGYVVVALCLASLLIGMLVGAVLAIVIYDRATRRTASIQRTGRPDDPTRMLTHVPGGEFAGIPSPIANSEQRAAYEKVVDRGAAQMMELQPGLTREEARQKARHALAELGAFNQGAVSG